MIRFYYQNTPSIEIDTLGLNCTVDASVLLFVCFFLMIGIGYYGFLKLFEAVSFNAAFFAGKYNSVSQFLFDVMDIFFSEMRLLILLAIRKVYETEGDGILEFNVSFDGT